jgi:predicted nucleic acid-binding protein
MTDAPSGQAIYLETNFFIKAVEGTAETSASPKKLLTILRSRPGIAVTSEITFAETLAPPKRADALPLHMKRRAYFDLLLWSGFIGLIPVSRDILIETADLRMVARMKLPDAIHLVSAIRGKCRYLVSADGDFRKLPVGMTLVRPDDGGIESLLRAIA